jgi:hypothetical protein
MSLGAWIFLSAIFLGLVALFIATRGQWNWKKIITWPWKKIVIRAAIVITSLMLLTGIVLFGRYIYLKIADRPRVQKEFLGLTLDSTKEDIKFLKGTPTKEEKDMWYYGFSETSYSYNPLVSYWIIFANNKISFIEGAGQFLDIQNIRPGDSYDKVIERFGEPSYISHSKDGLTRVVSFKKYNVWFTLQKGLVIHLGIYNPSFGDLRLKEEASTIITTRELFGEISKGKKGHPK